METQQTNKTLFLSHALLFSVAHESHLSYAMTILTTAHIHFIAGISKDQYMRKGGARMSEEEESKRNEERRTKK